MKRFGIVSALALASVFLVGCGTAEGEETPGKNYPPTHYSFYQDTPEGKVLCIWAKDGYGGGLSCDWSGTP